MTFSCIHEVEDPLTTAPTDTLKVRCVSEWWLWDFIRDISSSESLSSPSDWWTAGKWCLCPQQLLALSSTALKCISEETFNQNHIKSWTKPDPVVWDFCGFWRSGLWRARSSPGLSGFIPLTSSRCCSWKCIRSNSLVFPHYFQLITLCPGTQEFIFSLELRLPNSSCHETHYNNSKKTPQGFRDKPPQDECQM